MLQFRRDWGGISGRRFPAVAAARSHRKSPDRLMCSPAQRRCVGEPRVGCRLSYRHSGGPRHRQYKVEFQKTMRAAMTRLSPEARNCCASAPRSAIRPCLKVQMTCAREWRCSLLLSPAWQRQRNSGLSSQSSIMWNIADKRKRRIYPLSSPQLQHAREKRSRMTRSDQNSSAVPRCSGGPKGGCSPCSSRP